MKKAQKIQTVRDGMQQQADAEARRDARRFQKGTGCYKCECCGKLTRSTGRGDNENTGLCAPCFDLASLENHHADNCSSHEPMVRDIAACPECGAEARALIAAGAFGTEGQKMLDEYYAGLGARPVQVVKITSNAPAKPKVAALRALVAALDGGDAEKIAAALAYAKDVLK